MLARLQSVTFVRLWATLLLVVIGLQATGPVIAPLEQSHGSAFAAATYEMALVVQRNDKVARQALIPQPVLPSAVLPQPLPAGPAMLPALPAPRPDATGPPPLDIRSWQPAPRAPPHP